MQMSKTSQVTRVEWNKLNWRKLERAVFKLQNRIFRAAQRGDEKAVRKLQKTLARSWSAQCLAVRKGIKLGNQLQEITGLTPRLFPRKSPQYQTNNPLLSEKSEMKGRQNRLKGIDHPSQMKRGDRNLTPAESIRTCTKNLSLLFKANKTAKIEDLIPKINSIIQGWIHQNRHQCNRTVRKKIYHDLHLMIMHWGHRRTQSYKKAYHRYWQQRHGLLNPSYNLIKSSPNGGIYTQSGSLKPHLPNH